MDENEYRKLIERVYNLEETVRGLQRSIELLGGKITPEKPKPAVEKPEPAINKLLAPQKAAEPVRPTAQARPPRTSISRAPRKTFEIPAHMRTSEYWLNKVGMGLLLFAVIFFFKYSVDKGWLTPPVRIFLGLALGVALLILGLRIYINRRHFSLVLIGGSIATFYITGFAAFQMFSLVSYQVAFGYMVVITVMAFFISMMQSEAVLSLIGTVGGLGTPFFLYPTHSVPGLMLYTCLVLAGASAIYFYQGWNSLLWLSVLCGGIVYLIGLADVMGHASQATLFDRWAMQAGIISGCVMLWMVPVIREVVGSKSTRWKAPTIGFGDDSIFREVKKITAYHVHLLTVAVPLVSLGITLLTWPDLSDVSRGFIVMGFAAFCGLLAWRLNNYESFKKLALTHTITALSFLSLGFWFIFKGETLLFILAAEAVVLHMVAIWLGNKSIKIFAHVLSGILLIWMIERLYPIRSTIPSPAEGGTAVFNIQALTDLWVIALAYLMSARLGSSAEKRIYLLFAFAALAGWLCRELSGNLLFALVTVEAVILFFAGRWKEDRIVRLASHLFFAILGIWLIVRLATPDTGATAVFNLYAITNLFFIAVVFALSRKTRSAPELYAYCYYSHVALLGWFLSELVSLGNGQGYVTIAWGVYAAILLVVGLRLNSGHVRIISLATLFLVVGKLFLVDLARLEVLWRILLFLGFGGLFLFLSYYFQDLWKSKPKEDTGQNGSGDRIQTS